MGESTKINAEERAKGANPDYPLMDSLGGRLRAASGRSLAEINEASLEAGDLLITDLQVSPDTLRAQATVARQAGYSQLAGNLVRAAELTAVPNAEVLRIYELLRPGRATYAELMELAEALAQQYGATECSRLVREASEVYQARGLLKR
jgi:propanediol dehydratase small subunit